MRRSTLVFFLSMSCAGLASAAPHCDRDMATLKVDEQLECAKLAAEQTSLAKKMLEQRLVGLMAKIRRRETPSAERQSMADLAVEANKALEEIAVQDKAATEAYGKLKGVSLKLKATRRKIALDTAAMKEARKLADDAESARLLSESEQKDLSDAIAKLAGAPDEAQQRDAVLRLKEVNDRAVKAKQAADTARQAVIAKAQVLAEVAVSDKEPTDAEFARYLEDTIRAQWAAQAKANDLILSMHGPFPPEPDPADSKETDWERAKQRAYLQFLQSHPLLNSEVSGSGVQVRSGAGDGAITLKQAFQWGRTASRELSLTLSAPINSDSEAQMGGRKNNVLLDELQGDVTGKLDFTYVSPFMWGANDSRGFKIYGASASLGFKKFSYFDPATAFAQPADPLKTKENHKSYGLAGFWGFSPPDSKSLFMLRYARQFEKEANPASVICPPDSQGVPYVKCHSGALGSPVSKRNGIVSVEARHAFKYFALSGTASYDHVNKIKSVAIPVHFSVFNRGFGVFSDEEPQFSAGVIAGWRSDTQWSFGLFAGVPFSLFSGD